ncbi:MAG: hypothetical protein WBD40_01405 [Tepidisphaeraceae bacterium]
MLTAIYHGAAHSPTGWVSGATAADEANKWKAADRQIENPEHGLHLLRELTKMGLVEGRVLTRPRDQLRLQLDQVNYRTTALGDALMRGDVPPVPGVWDDRAPEEDA